MEVIVEYEERLDKYLSLNTDFSRALIQKMINDDYILVNGKKEKANYRLRISDLIFIKEGYIKEPNIQAENIKIDIIYEDNDLMVINKPSGMVVHPGNGNKEHTLVNALMGYTNNLSDGSNEFRPGIVHRIDKDTSGLMLVAKNNKAHELLAEGFKSKKIKRTYVALVIGEIKTDTATIDAPIGRDKKDRKKMTVTNENSKNAITHFKVLKRYKGYTLLELNLDTGRTHQIRVHMKYIGYPIFNDPVYSKQKTEFGQFLHSKKIEFIHPITNEKLIFEKDIPKEFHTFLETLTSLEEI